MVSINHARPSRAVGAGVATAMVLAGLLALIAFLPAPAGADDSAWQSETVAPSTLLGQNLRGVSCTKDGTCMAVGSGNGLIRLLGSTETLAESNAGGSWTLTPTLNPAQADGDAFSAVSCPSDTQCVAVGTQTHSRRTLAEQWNGSSWTTSRAVDAGVPYTVTPQGGSPYSYLAFTRLNGISCPAVGNCFAVGTRSSNTQRQQAGAVGGIEEPIVEQWSPTTGDYQNPSGGTTVMSAQPTTSPMGTYDATWSNGSVTVSQNGEAVMTVPAQFGGFSPDDQSFVTESLNNAVLTVNLYNLDGASPVTPIFSAAPIVTSSRLAFSPTGHYLMFAYTTPTQTFIDVADSTADDPADEHPFSSGAIPTMSPPGNAGQTFGSVAYGFAPGDDSRFVYYYVSGATQVTWHWVDLWDAPQTIFSDQTTDTSAYSQFSPSGAALAIVSADSSANASVDLFDTETGHAVGAGGPWSLSQALKLKSTATDQVATVNGQDTKIGPNDYGNWIEQDAAEPVVPSGTAYNGAELGAISCVATDDCVAIGDYAYYDSATNSTYQWPLIERWDGSTWTVDFDAHQEFTLDSISCVADDTSSTSDECTVVAHDPTVQVLDWTGQGTDPKWTVSDGPDLGSGSWTHLLLGLSCVSVQRCTAVGRRVDLVDGGPQLTRTMTLASEWNGSAWSNDTTPNPGAPDVDNLLTSVSCWASGECVAVGTSGQAGANGALILEEGSSTGGGSGGSGGSGGGSGGSGGSGGGGSGAPVGSTAGGGQAGSADLIADTSLVTHRIHARHALRILVKLKAAATIHVVIYREVKATRRGRHRTKAHFKRIGQLSLHGVLGANTFRITRVHGQKLKIGTYEIRLTAGGASHTLKFKVVA